MKYFYIVLSIIILHSSTLSAQKLTANRTIISFPDATELLTKVDSIILTNTTSTTINVDSVRFITFYGSNPFYVTVPTFSIAANATYKLFIYFNPTHNIAHNAEMIISPRETGAIKIEINGNGRYSKTYYNNSYNLSEENLKLALQTITGNGFVTLGYNTARDYMYMFVDNKKVNGQGASVNTLECVYTGTIITNFANRTEVQNMGFNCEHTWPQSLGANNDPMQCDMHHLYPVTGTENSNRSNDQFGNTSAPGIYALRNVQKGATSRSVLYFATRYYQNTVVDFNFLSTNNEETILRTWCKQYPPTTIDKKRNDDIFTYQNNRNPYVDYPQFLDRITVLASNSVSIANYQILKSHARIQYGNNLVPNTNYTFDFAWANNGNRDISFSNVRIINSGILSVTPTTTGSVAPGDGKVFRVTLNFSPGEISSSSFTDTLKFDVLTPTLQTIKIPIQGTISTVGLEENLLKENIKIFPNPVAEILFIQANENVSIKQIELFDAEGNQIIHTSFTPQIDVSQYSKGIYTLRIETDKGILTQQFVINY